MVVGLALMFFALVDNAVQGSYWLLAVSPVTGFGWWTLYKMSVREHATRPPSP
jgi:hypothetical protein